jgi:hypothetical protein
MSPIHGSALRLAQTIVRALREGSRSVIQATSLRAPWAGRGGPQRFQPRGHVLLTCPAIYPPDG